MALLAGIHYDPSTAVAKSTATLTAMTALDTTNLRLTFNAPSVPVPDGSGLSAVLVRLRASIEGSATSPNVLYGVMEGSTVVGRAAPIASAVTSATSARNTEEALFLVTGLTPGSSHTYDAAYAVQAIQAGSNLQYGGPNNTTTDDAWGGYSFDIWETKNLLAGKFYDPSTAAAYATTALQAMTAFDTTNLRLSFTTPPSGNVLVRIRCVVQQGTTPGCLLLLGVLEGASVVARSPCMGGRTCLSAIASGVWLVHEGEMLITGLTPGSVHTYDAAFNVDIAGGVNTQIQAGGPDNATGANAWGGLAYEIWAA